VFSSFWKNSQKSPDGFECAAKGRMSDNPILGFSVMNRLAAKVTPPGDANMMQKCFFSFVLFAQQEPSGACFIPLGAKLLNSMR